MALLQAPTTIVPGTLHGAVPQAPAFLYKLTIAGDSAYPTGGSTDLDAAMRAQDAYNKRLDIRDVQGYGYTAGALTHLVRWDAANSTLLVYQLSDGTEVADTTDISAVSFDLTVFAE